ncbi:hypothetical protein J2Z76_000172 [Sedimentibacter acidaminivorans]|uniref:Uncharacterized protein n=1 Tax=Sedimentibacter acidaminivorans TaxID=913099 RepID=A0ABS4G9H5_9FIRM|nr:hypothetical protein [Sedimentibacter acidaminivorans]
MIDKGKLGESRGRKATGLKVNNQGSRVTLIANTIKNVLALFGDPIRAFLVYI